MLASLTAITSPRGPNCHWKVEDNKIIQTPGENHRLVNLINLIRSVQFASNELSSADGKSLSGNDVERIYTPLAKTSVILQRAIQKKSWIERFILTILQYIFTGTTLAQAINSAKTIYSQKLICDAQYALQNKSCYDELARKYTLPDVALTYSCAVEIILNPLLYHLKQAFTSEWQKILWLLEDGNTLQNTEVMDHCDKAMELGLLLTKLSVQYELVALHERKYPSVCPTKESLAKLLANQGGYPYWVINLVGQFYTFIRIYPTYSNNKWHSGHTTERPFMQQFYQKNTRPSLWRSTFNAICYHVAEHVDREVFLNQDHRFYIDEDILDMQDIKREYDHDDYIEKQLLINTW